MFERLDEIEARYDELTTNFASPEIMNDSARYQKTAKAYLRTYRDRCALSHRRFQMESH